MKKGHLASNKGSSLISSEYVQYVLIFRHVIDRASRDFRQASSAPPRSPAKEGSRDMDHGHSGHSTLLPLPLLLLKVLEHNSCTGVLSLRFPRSSADPTTTCSSWESGMEGFLLSCIRWCHHHRHGLGPMSETCSTSTWKQCRRLRQLCILHLPALQSRLTAPSHPMSFVT